MPHSPRLYRDRLWIANSGNGELGYLDQENGQFEPVAFCPGYMRGLAFLDRFALVGLSLPRYNRVFSGLGLDDSLKNKDAEPLCGIMVIDLDTGNIAHWLRFEGGLVTELYDLQILNNVRCPTVLGFRSDEIQRLITFKENGTTVRHNLQAGTDTLNKEPKATDIEPSPSLSSREKGSEEYRFQVSVNMSITEIVNNYSSLTFPPLSERARGNKLHEPLMCITAADQSGMVGMGLAEIRPNRTAQIVSLFVKPEHRNRKIGLRLINNLEKVVRTNGAQIIDLTYRTDWPGNVVIERLLKTSNWSAPVGHSIQCKTTIDRVKKSRRVNEMQAGPDFEIFPWV